MGYGTGWLVSARLLLTNHHVIESRRLLKETPATYADFDLQEKNTVAWFDYYSEGKFAGPAVAVTEIIASDRVLDYALLRLEDSPGLPARSRMTLARNSKLEQGARLNIVQCPDGGPLRFAIRNNFFVGRGENRIRSGI